MAFLLPEGVEIADLIGPMIGNMIFHAVDNVISQSDYKEILSYKYPHITQVSRDATSKIVDTIRTPFNKGITSLLK